MSIGIFAEKREKCWKCLGRKGLSTKKSPADQAAGERMGVSSRPSGGRCGNQPRQQPQVLESSSCISIRKAGTETYTGQRVLLPPLASQERSGKEGRVTAPPLPFPLLEQQPQRQQRF